MSNLAQTNKSRSIDFTKFDPEDLIVAQILCDMRAIEDLAQKNVQHKSKILEVTNVEGQEADHPIDLTVSKPCRTKPAAAGRHRHKGNFPCEFPDCLKTFATSKYLNQHKVSHKPSQHPCTLCVPPKNFRRRSALVQHRRNRHLCKPYSCDYVDCTKAFKNSKLLEAHRRREHSKCLFCCETFLNSAGLKLHLRKCRVLEDEKAAERNAKRRKEVEQNSRRSSALSADQSGEWSMSATFSRSPSTGTSGYSS